MFHAGLQLVTPPNTAGVPVHIPAEYFKQILDNCSEYQNNLLKRLEIVSFSYNPDWSHVLSGAPLQVAGLVVNKSQTREDVLANWLVH